MNKRPSADSSVNVFIRSLAPITMMSNQLLWCKRKLIKPGAGDQLPKKAANLLYVRPLIQSQLLQQQLTSGLLGIEGTNCPPADEPTRQEEQEKKLTSFVEASVWRPNKSAQAVRLLL